MAMAMAATVTPFQTCFPRPHLLPSKLPPPLSSSTFSLRLLKFPHRSFRHEITLLRSNASRNPSSNNPNRPPVGGEDEGVGRKVTQAALWVMEGVYILWLFLLPFAPGDPVWAISSDTINSLLGLSLNFFYVLPLINVATASGPASEKLTDKSLLLPPSIRTITSSHASQPSQQAPPVSYSPTGILPLNVSGGSPYAAKGHLMSEGLFNFVIGWTLMFAPLLFTDLKNDRYKGSLDVLWGFQMFLTNTFLIPYMAIRLNKADREGYRRKLSQLGTVMIQGAHTVGLIGGVVSLLSVLWGFYGRSEGDFGSVNERWDYLLSYLGSERLAYAFVWDIVLYAIFQPWLIGDNLANVQENRVTTVNYLRFVPVVGLVAYLLCLNRDEELYVEK